MANIPDIIFTTEFAVKVEEKYYFVASEMNVVCAIDLQTEKMEVIGSIPEEDIFAERVCIKIVVWKEKLIFIPMNGRKIWFFHLRKRTWLSLPIINETGFLRKIRQAFIYRNKLFMVGCHYPAIICVDLTTKDIQYIEEPFKTVENIYKKRVFGYFRHDCVLREHLLYFASFITNKVLVFNLENFHWEYVTVGNAEKGYSGITWDGSFFWLAPNDRETIVKWDGDRLDWEYPIPFQGMDKNILFLGVVFWNNNIIFPASEAEYTLILHQADIAKGRVEKKQYSFYTVCDNKEIICGDKNGNIMIHTDKGEKYCVKCSIPGNELLKKINLTDEQYKLHLQNKFFDSVYENANFGLKTLLSCIDMEENDKYVRENPSREIWKKMIS